MSIADGPRRATATCQLYIRHFKNEDTIYVEPWRSNAFPVIKDLIVARSALDRIIPAGGYISVSAGSAPEANATLVSKQAADLAMDAQRALDVALVWPRVPTIQRHCLPQRKYPTLH